MLARHAAGLFLAGASFAAAAQVPTLEAVQVTATREARPAAAVPASISLVSAEQMRAYGAHDLREALALVAGVEISPGGDGGPAGSVPARWGLREFDAFLLVIDGVPAGGAFNPQLTSLSLVDVERIEVMRGSAPVMYGATSFVGVIHVIHYAAGEAPARAAVAAASHGGGRAQLAANLGPAQSFALEAERVASGDDDSSFRRGRLLYRAGGEIAGGHAGFDFDASRTRQRPGSPSPRAGASLDPLVAIGANHNPADAHLDEDRFQAVARYSRPTALGAWDSTFSLTRTNGDFVRGFLGEDYASATGDNAEGFEQQRRLDDIYFDTHLQLHPAPALELSLGFDWLYGRARYANRLFGYRVGLDGGDRPPASAQPTEDEPEGADWRSFQGLYLQAGWRASDRIALLAGLRLNHTREGIRGDDPEGGPPPAWARREHTRLSGSLGASWQLWRRGDDGLSLYGDLRNTFKPAALDFGPEAEARILLPESARSAELGLKGEYFRRRLSWDLSAFAMDFDNLVVTQDEGGAPGLVNAGRERFKGVEFEAELRLAREWRLAAHYAHHDARFGDYEQLFGDTLTQLRGRRLELSPRNLGGLGLAYAPASGWRGSLVVDRVGERWLNKRNTALAPAYTTVDATLGYRFTRCELRLSGRNLGDRRDPVAESELGEAQYYRLPGRRLELGLDCDA
jgi:iron complex outermembrane receptor protein